MTRLQIGDKLDAAAAIAHERYDLPLADARHWLEWYNDSELEDWLMTSTPAELADWLNDVWEEEE